MEEDENLEQIRGKFKPKFSTDQMKKEPAALSRSSQRGSGGGASSGNSESNSNNASKDLNNVSMVRQETEKNVEIINHIHCEEDSIKESSNNSSYKMPSSNL